MPNQDAPPKAQGLSRSRARCSFGAVLAFCVYHAGFALAQTPPTDSSATKQASSPPSRVIVPLGSDENLRARITSIQLVGELPADVPLDEVSAILSAPRSITRLSELQLLAQRIEQFIQSKGYPLAYVLIPNQEIFNGRIRMLAVNGKIERVVRVQGDSLRFTEERAQEYFRDLIAIGGFKRADFERTMLLLNELPAMSARLVLSPGSASGLVNANLHLQEGPFARWSVNLNNQGAESTGRERLTVNLKLNDLSGRGDRLSLTTSKTSRNLSASVLDYRTPIGISGLTAHLTTLYSGFGVDAGLNSLSINGSTHSHEVGLSYPLFLRFGKQLYAEASRTRRDTGSAIEMLEPTRKAIQVQRLGLRGSAADTLGAGGVTAGRLSLFSGELQPRSGYSDLSRRSFRKQTFEISRSQTLTADTSLMLSLSGQRTHDALDGSEQMPFGGAGAVRAYGAATLFADQGNLYKVELTHVLSHDLGGAGVLRGFVFYDRGLAFMDPVTGTRNVISGAGIGLSLMRWTHYELRATYARRIGTSTSGGMPEDHSHSGQFWLNLLAFF